jgi:hypothetical protein
VTIAKQLLYLLTISAACVFCLLVEAQSDRLHDCPGLMLWAWERPENLLWINPRKVGVAYLSRTITLSDEAVRVYQRRQPLLVPANTYMMAVVRLESNPTHLPKFTRSQVDLIVKDILDGARGDSIKALQVDFDARQSERPGYRQILQKLRQALKPRTGLSMTALASWCAGDYWLDRLPVDEAVPMFFRLGVAARNRSEYISYLSSKFSSKSQQCKCKNSIGIATDEFMDQRNFANRRIYIFSPHSWVSQQKVSSVDLSRFQ